MRVGMQASAMAMVLAGQTALSIQSLSLHSALVLIRLHHKTQRLLSICITLSCSGIQFTSLTQLPASSSVS